MEQAHCGAMRSTAGAGGDKEDGAEAELRKARFFAPAKNDPKNDRKRDSCRAVQDV